MIAFLKSHKRAIVPGLALAWTAFQLIHPDVWGRLVDVSFFALFLLIIASQFFWFGRILDLGERLVPEKLRHGWLTADALETLGQADAARVALQELRTEFPNSERLRKRLEQVDSSAKEQR